MELAKVRVSGYRLAVDKICPNIAGTVGATVSFAFDDLWDSMDSKTLVWRAGSVTKDDTTASGIVPAQVLETPGCELFAGVYGTKDGTATPTLWASLGYIYDGAEPSGDESTDPGLPVWAQLSSRIGELEGPGIANAVAAYLEENPAQPGAPGKDGVSPTIDVSKTGNVTTLTITDATGTKTATIRDGEDGVSETAPDWVATKEVSGGNTVYIAENEVVNGVWQGLQIPLEVGATYDVIVNGEIYTCESRSNGKDGVILGNNTQLTSNSYPFSLQWAGGSAVTGMFYRNHLLPGALTLKVTDHAEVVYHKMPEAYLPDCAVKSVNGIQPQENGNVAIDIPSIAGLATEEYVDNAIGGIDLPAGEDWELVAYGTLTEDTGGINIDKDKDGNSFSYSNMLFVLLAEGTAGNETVVYIPNGKWSGAYYGNADKKLPKDWRRAYWLEMYANETLFYGKELGSNVIFGQAQNVDQGMQRITSMKAVTQNGNFKAGTEYALYKRG